METLVKLLCEKLWKISKKVKSRYMPVLMVRYGISYDDFLDFHKFYQHRDELKISLSEDSVIIFDPKQNAKIVVEGDAEQLLLRLKRDWPNEKI